MRIGIFHFSDFHIKEQDTIISDKIEAFNRTLNQVKNIDKAIIVFSGDLGYSGKINEYKKSRGVLSALIAKLKGHFQLKFVDLFMVPGNHDLCLNRERTSGEIQELYNNNLISQKESDELKLFDNYYNISHAKAIHKNEIAQKFFVKESGAKIQFNIINTALFSTTKPDDKECHYFPKEYLYKIDREEDSDFCFTIMHHSFEWFRWDYKNDLERQVHKTSEIVFWGHDHVNESKRVSIGKERDTIISCGGSIDFSKIDGEDSYSLIIVDTETRQMSNCFFIWDTKNRMFVNERQEGGLLMKKNKELYVKDEYLKTLKMDTFNNFDDYSKCFVFPKLTSNKKDEFGKKIVIKDCDECLNFIKENKRINIIGETNSGKSTLMKFLFENFLEDKVPLFFSIEPGTKLKAKNFIKRLFEDEYSENTIDYEKFKQLEKDKRVLFLDGWDKIYNTIEKEKLINDMEEEFAYIIISTSQNDKLLTDTIKDGINNSKIYQELVIEPFYAEKRRELVWNICKANKQYDEEKIDKINKVIDNVVDNNIKLFSFNPRFIVIYTNYFLSNNVYEYTSGEAVFSQIFEFEIQKAIINHANKKQLDDVIVSLEQIAGYMFNTKNDLISTNSFSDIISNYNKEYGEKFEAKSILDICLRCGILIQTEDLHICFSNKNYLSYFIAKYLLALSQSEANDFSGINYALNNICFSINSDIILFLSYLTSNTKMIVSIAEKADELFKDWEDLDFNNIFFCKENIDEKISAPTHKDKKRIDDEQEKYEKKHRPKDLVAKGSFDYKEEDVNKHQYKLLKAVKYTEILCKALPVFERRLKLPQKEKLIEGIYSYPHKVAKAVVKPICDDLEGFYKFLLSMTEKHNIEKDGGGQYTKEDIIKFVDDMSRASVLAYYDYFADLCTNDKTIDLLDKKDLKNINDQILRLMMIENSGNHSYFFNEAKALFDEEKKDSIKNIIKLEVRKHLLCNTYLPIDKKHKTIDYFFGSGSRKNFLTIPKKK